MGNASSPIPCVAIAIDCPICRRRLQFNALWQHGPEGVYHGMTAEHGNADGTYSEERFWDTLSVLPSVRFQPYTAHGKRIACAPHFTITNGELSLS